MAHPDDFDIGEYLDVILSEFPGMERDPAFLFQLADEVRAGRIADVSPYDRSTVAAELRRRAMRL